MNINTFKYIHVLWTFLTVHISFSKNIIFRKKNFLRKYLLKVTLCWNIFLWQEKIVYFSWHFLAQKCLRINDLLFFPPYTIYNYSQFPSVKIVNGVSGCGVNVYGDQISKNVKSKLKVKLVKRYYKKKNIQEETEKVVKLSNFLHEKDIFHLPESWD